MASTSPRLLYGVCAGPTDKFERIAAPSIRAVNPNSEILVRRGQSSIHSAYNSIILEAQRRPASGLVLLHDDVEIRDPDIETKLERLLAGPAAGIVGAAGATGIESIDWWWYGGCGWVDQFEEPADFGRGEFEVDTVDGVLMALSPAALNVAVLVPEEYPGFHGYDAELCSQIKAAGLRVQVADLDLMHHKPPLALHDADVHADADRAWRRRWRKGLKHELIYRSTMLRCDKVRSPGQKVRRLVSP